MKEEIINRAYIYSLHYPEELRLCVRIAYERGSMDLLNNLKDNYERSSRECS